MIHTAPSRRTEYGLGSSLTEEDPYDGGNAADIFGECRANSNKSFPGVFFVVLDRKAVSLVTEVVAKSRRQDVTYSRCIVC